jgi:hypothetical protein
MTDTTDTSDSAMCKYDLHLMVDEFIEAVTDEDAGDVPRGFTRQELLDIMRKFYDREYASERKIAPKPTAAEVEKVVQHLVTVDAGSVAYEKDGLFFFTPTGEE